MSATTHHLALRLAMSEIAATARRMAAADAASPLADPATAAASRDWLQAVCVMIPIYNVFAATQDWPQIPLPGYCSLPIPPAPPAAP